MVADSMAHFEIYSECRKAITLLPSQLRGTMILAELPNSLAIAVISETWRVERLFDNVSLLTCVIIQMYNHPQLYTFRLVIPIRLYKCIMFWQFPNYALFFSAIFMASRRDP